LIFRIPTEALHFFDRKSVFELPYSGKKPLFMVAFRLDTMALKSTSSPIVISTAFAQGVANAFQVDSVDLQLNPLDQEVFVVTAVKIDFDTRPYAIAVPSTSVIAAYEVSICKTRPAAMLTLASSNVVATDKLFNIQAFDATSDVLSNDVSQNSPMDTPPSQLEYLDIIATDSYFIAMDGTNTTGGASGSIRIFGYRARADAATYAALVQSEVLSA
jgi:hypothetical protein